MNVPEGLRYTDSHEWIRVDGSEIVVGITDFAQHELTDIVFVDLPEAGRQVQAHDPLCVVESTKVAADVYAPVAGTIVAVNGDLGDHPDRINHSPYDLGWLFRLAPAALVDVEALKSAEEYRTLIHD